MLTTPNRTRSAALYVVLIALCAAMMLPIAWAIVTALKPLDDAYAFPPTFSLDSLRWSNLGDAVRRLPVVRFLLNALLITGTSVIGAVLTASMAGYALARGTFRGRSACYALVIVSMFIPAHALLVPRFLLYDQLGWIDTYKPLIVPAWLGGGAFNVFLFRQFFRTIPRRLDEAAWLDGATPWQTFRHVLLPAARPATMTVGLLSFVFHWQDFLDPLIYLSDFETYPISLGLRMYQSTAGTWVNELMVVSLMALAPVAVVFLLCQKYVMRGLGVIHK